jgi:hypothetical protein
MTLAPEHELVAKITTPEQKAAVEATLKELQNVPKENRMADVNYFGCITGHLLSIHYQSQFRFDWGLCFGRIRNRSCYGSSLWR